MTPEQRERVRKIQERFDARGLQAIAFDIQAGPSCPPSHVISDVCEALEAFLDGRVHKMPPFGDSQRATRQYQKALTDLLAVVDTSPGLAETARAVSRARELAAK
jgi:hypothetical protein